MDLGEQIWKQIDKIKKMIKYKKTSKDIFEQKKILDELLIEYLKDLWYKYGYKI